MPTVDSISPSSTHTIALTSESPTRPPRQDRASTINAKYSAGPKASAHSARSGANSTMPTTATIEPEKEAKADSERAGPARPFLAIG